MSIFVSIREKKAKKRKTKTNYSVVLGEFLFNLMMTSDIHGNNYIKQ